MKKMLAQQHHLEFHLLCEEAEIKPDQLDEAAEEFVHVALNRIHELKRRMRSTEDAYSRMRWPDTTGG